MSEGLLTLEDILAEAARQGLDMSERTFRYYAVMGLLPSPLKRPSGAEDARVHYYPASIVGRLLEIRDLQAQGYSLKQIKSLHALQVARPAEARPRGGGRDAAAWLQFFAADGPAEAARRFVETAGDDDDSLRSAALQYYEALLDGALGEGRGKGALQSALAAMTPLQIDALMQPLRRRRDDERRRRAGSGEPAVVRRLRQLANATRAWDDEARRTLQASGAGLAAVRRRLDRLGAGPASIATAHHGIRSALDLLVSSVARLSDDGPSPEVAAAIDRAAQMLSAATEMLTAMRTLLLESEGREA